MLAIQEKRVTAEAVVSNLAEWAAVLAGFQGMTLRDVVEAALIKYVKAAKDEP